MTTRNLLLAGGGALVLAGLAISAPTLAHHAFAAEFDSSKPIVLDGVVTKARFVNPHSWIYLDVRGRNGVVTNWGFEFGTPSSLRASGLTKEAVAPGTPIRIAGFRAKNGGAFGYSTTILLRNGRRFQTGGAPDAPPPPIGN